jgi:hypothetical protein
MEPARRKTAGSFVQCKRLEKEIERLLSAPFPHRDNPA